MRTTLLLRSILAALAITTAVPACSSKSQDITVENIQEKGALTEQHEAATVVWSVTSDGQVRALVKTPDGKPVEKGATGSLTVKGSEAGATPTTAPLTQDEKTGLLGATIPKLDDDITEMKYEIKVDGKVVAGALHLPPGGTKELEESAKESAGTKIEGKKGPNGGVIQVVGDDVVEVVADKATGKVRVYVLDDDLKPVKIEDRKITVAVVTAKGPEVIVVTPDPGGLYFTGKMSVVANPVKLTVAVTYKGHTHVCLHGHHPGGVVVVGPSAPAVVVLATVNWDVNVDVTVPTPVIVVDDHHHHHGKGKAKGKHKHKGDVHIHIH
ncbi:MAG: hypothetical protein IT372_40075 [Polyangiaceae bacterium]|nr:hypothetical protein [Polyangiaceae bacterium]